MTFDDYQMEANKTRIYPEAYSIVYPALGLASEAGEVAAALKRVLRDDGGIMDQKAKERIAGEIGDCLWYLAALCSDLGLSLNEVALKNTNKLLDRLERGVLGGNGDNR